MNSVGSGSANNPSIKTVPSPGVRPAKVRAAANDAAIKVKNGDK
jgi:hypothetical protein